MDKKPGNLPKEDIQMAHINIQKDTQHICH